MQFTMELYVCDCLSVCKNVNLFQTFTLFHLLPPFQIDIFPLPLTCPSFPPHSFLPASTITLPILISLFPLPSLASSLLSNLRSIHVRFSLLHLLLSLIIHHQPLPAPLLLPSTWGLWLMKGWWGGKRAMLLLSCYTLNLTLLLLVVISIKGTLLAWVPRSVKLANYTKAVIIVLLLMF